MNLRDFNKHQVNEPTNAIAWAVFYEDDGQHITTTFEKGKAEYYDKMAYVVMPLYVTSDGKI